MSKPRYDWWPYVKGMIRRYPELKEQYKDLHNQSITASYSGIPHRENSRRTVEDVLIRELPTNSQREYEAVRRAVKFTERYHNGRQRLEVIKMVLWDKQYTLEGAAMVCHVSYRTAQRWHEEFIHCVARLYGLED